MGQWAVAEHLMNKTAKNLINQRELDAWWRQTECLRVARKMIAPGFGAGWRKARALHPAPGPSSLRRQRGLRLSAVRFFDEEQQGQGGEGGDHQEFVVVVVGDDLGLLVDHGVERGAAAGGEGIPE